MRLSKSKINSFLQCPRHFKYVYIDNYNEPANKYMQLGLVVHQIAEDAAKILQKKENITRKDIYDAIYQSIPMTSFDVEVHCQSLLDFFTTLLIENNYFIFSVEGDIYDDDLDLRGIVDIVVEDPDTKELIVIDYKTGKHKSIKEYRKELCIYKYLIEKKYDRHVTSAGIFFTKTNTYRFLNFVEFQNKGAYITQEDYEAIFELIDWIRYRINKKDFPPNKQFLCKYCYFQDRCNYDGGF